MIMKQYNYYTLALDEYGQQRISGDSAGTVKMMIGLYNQNQTNNMLYNDATYVGFTYADIDDNYVIQYGDNKLKVYYVQKGRYNVVYMGLIK